MREINPPGHGGRIFNISSAGGYSGNPIMALYNAGKFGKPLILDLLNIRSLYISFGRVFRSPAKRNASSLEHPCFDHRTWRIHDFLERRLHD